MPNCFVYPDKSHFLLKKRLPCAIIKKTNRLCAFAAFFNTLRLALANLARSGKEITQQYFKKGSFDYENFGIRSGRAWL